MPRTPWKIHDFSTGGLGTFTFTTNPNQFTPPGRAASVSWERTTAPNGQAIFFQQLDDPGEGEFSGVLHTNAEKVALEAEVEKWYPLQLEDDRGNQWWVIFTSVQWTRLRRHINPDTYEYTVKFTNTRQPVS